MLQLQMFRADRPNCKDGKEGRERSSEAPKGHMIKLGTGQQHAVRVMCECACVYSLLVITRQPSHKACEFHRGFYLSTSTALREGHLSTLVRVKSVIVMQCSIIVIILI